MPTERLGYTLYIKDEATGKLSKLANVAESAGQKMDKGFKTAGESASQLERTLSRLQRTIVAFAGVYAFREMTRGLKTLVGAGIEYNKIMEQSKIGIAAVIAAQTDLIGIQGQQLVGYEKITAAQKIATKVMDDLRKANLQTAATLPQLITMFQQALPHALAEGFDIKRVEEFVVAMSQAATAMSIPLNMMAEEMRSMLKGTITPKNTLIAVALGMDKKAIKEMQGNADELFAYIMNHLKAFQQSSIDIQHSWGGVITAVSQQFQEVMGEATGELFKATKESLKELVDYLQSGDFKSAVAAFVSPLDDFVKRLPAGVKAVTETFRAFAAEALRIGMLIDKAGGTASTLSIFTLGTSGQKAAEWAEVFRNRYKESEKALKNMAMISAGWLPVTDAISKKLHDAAVEGKKIADTTTVKIGNKADGTLQVLRYYRRLKDTDAELATVKTRVKAVSDELVKQEAAIDKVVTAYLRKTEALKMTTRQREIYNATEKLSDELHKLGATDTTEAVKLLTEKINAYYNEKEALEEVNAERKFAISLIKEELRAEEKERTAKIHSDVRWLAKQLREEESLRKKAIKEAEKIEKEARDKAKQEFQHLMDNIQDISATAFENIMTGSIKSWEDMWDFMKSYAIKIIAQIASQKIVVPIAAQLLGEGGIGGSGFGIGNLTSAGSLLSKIPGVSSLANTWFGPGITGTGVLGSSAFSGAMAAPLSVQAGLGASAPATVAGAGMSLGTLASTLGLGIGAVVAGGKIMDSLFGDKNPNTPRSSITIGSALPSVYGSSDFDVGASTITQHQQLGWVSGRDAFGSGGMPSTHDIIQNYGQAGGQYVVGWGNFSETQPDPALIKYFTDIIDKSDKYFSDLLTAAQKESVSDLVSGTTTIEWEAGDTVNFNAQVKQWWIDRYKPYFGAIDEAAAQFLEELSGTEDLAAIQADMDSMLNVAKRIPDFWEQVSDSMEDGFTSATEAVANAIAAWNNQISNLELQIQYGGSYYTSQQQNTNIRKLIGMKYGFDPSRLGGRAAQEALNAMFAPGADINAMAAKFGVTGAELLQDTQAYLATFATTTEGARIRPTAEEISDAAGTFIDVGDHMVEISSSLADSTYDLSQAEDELLNARKEALQAIDDLLMRMGGGDLAPVQSAEWFQNTYSTMLSSALGSVGTTQFGDMVSELTNYIPDMLSFFQTFGGDYNQTYQGVLGDLSNLQYLSGGGSNGGDIHVRVFVGNQEIRDITVDTIRTDEEAQYQIRRVAG